MSIIEIIIGTLALIFGFFGYKKWSEGKGAAKQRYQTRREILESKKAVLEREKEKVDGKDEELERREERINEEIRQLNKNIAKELEESEERKREVDQLNDSDLADRVNELLGGTRD